MAPGYLIVAFDGSDAAQWHDVRDTCGDGFRSFIGGEFPEPVAEAVMDAFLARCLDPTGLMEAPVGPRMVRRVYRAGDIVRLVGVLGAVSGVVSWCDARGMRVETTLFNRRTEMWLPRRVGMIAL